MRSLFRRFGIAALSVALVATLIGSTQAGIIPWVYNVFFGPVGYGPAGYGAPAYPHGYPMTAGYRAAGYGCGPCRTPAQFSCRPSPCSPCSSGSCPTYVSYGPRSSCKTGQEVTGWKSEVTQTLKASDLDRRAPSPVDPAPAPTKTFSDGGSAVTKSADPSEQDSEVAKPATPAVAAEAAPGDINVPAVPVGTPAAPGALTTTGSGDNPGFVTARIGHRGTRCDSGGSSGCARRLVYSAETGRRSGRKRNRNAIADLSRRRAETGRGGRRDELEADRAKPPSCQTRVLSQRTDRPTQCCG